MLTARKSLCCVLVLTAALAGSCAGPSTSAARRTPLVELIERCAPSAVDITTATPRKEGGHSYNVGSGSIIHGDGYILTNNHVVRSGKVTARLHDGKTFPCRLVARMPGVDLALLKIDADRPLPPIKIGRNNDLMLGEPAIVIGNPSGLTHTVSTGIISRLSGGDSTAGMIQTTASITAGNSGGPLLNAKGELIGVVQAKGGEGIGFAIPVDRVRKVLPGMLADEQRSGIRLGLVVDTMGPAARVTTVAKDSPADRAGIRPGDVVRKAESKPLRDGVDFYLALSEKKAGHALPLEVRRDGKTIKMTPTLEEVPLRPPVQAVGVVNGLNVETYTGEWDRLPDFDKLKAANAGHLDKFSQAADAKLKDNFGLRFTGYVEVPADGVYTFYTTSDDGSRLLIGDYVVVNNDGLHGPHEQSGIIRLKKGKHPITVTFFERGGGEVLTVTYEGPNLKKQEIPPTALFHLPAPKPAEPNAKK